MTLRPRKSLGQHFLSDTNYCYKLIQYADVGPQDIVVEIGPGTGQLTKALLRTVRRVIAIEFDTAMIQHLEVQFAPCLGNGLGQLQLVHADVLTLDWDSILNRNPVSVIGNLPYNISTRILKRMLEIKDRFQDCTVMLQKEVAERILATPSSKEYGYFSLLMEYHFQRVKGFDVPPGVFVPKPKVISHVLKLIPQDPPHPVPDYGGFLKLMQRAFQQRRKTIWNNLKRDFDPAIVLDALATCDIRMQARPEELSLHNYACLSRKLLYCRST